QMDMNLALVIGSATAEEIAVADGGFESGRGPQFERLGGLDVLVAVKKNGGLSGSFEGLRIDERMQIGRDDFNRFKTSSAEFVGNPAGAAFDIGLVFALGTDTGDA